MKKLRFEIVPDGCWKSNLRNILSKKAWNFIRKDAITRALKKCSVCGRENCKLDAHEVWEYDAKKGVQKLKDVIAVCKDCHNAIHINRAFLVGSEERASKHYQKVNGCSYIEYKNDLKTANEINDKNNGVAEWKLDISWLKRFIQDEKV